MLKVQVLNLYRKSSFLWNRSTAICNFVLRHPQVYTCWTKVYCGFRYSSSVSIRNKYAKKGILRREVENYFDTLRPIRYVLVDDSPVDKNSPLNNFSILTDTISANILACSKVYSLDKPVEEVKFFPTNVVIKNQSYTFNDWEDFMDKLSTLCCDYSTSVLLRSSLEFMLKRPNYTDPQLDFQNNVHKTPLVQSFLDYLLGKNEFWDILQPTLIEYVLHCKKMKDYHAAFKLYVKVKDKVDVLGDKLLSLFIQTTSMLPESRVSYDLFEIFMSRCKENFASYENSCIAPFGRGAFLRNDTETGIQILMGNIRNNQFQHVDDLLFNCFFDCHNYTKNKEQWATNKETVEAFFNYLHSKSFILSKKNVKTIAKWFQQIENETWSVGWFRNRDIINGTCPVSNIKMESGDLSPEEYDCLKQNLLQLLIKERKEDVNLNYINQLKSVSRSDLLHNLFGSMSLGKFFDFLIQNGPFDLVVDGMNMAHSLTYSYKTFGKHKFKKSFRKLAVSIKKYLSDPANKGKKVCILFRSGIYESVMTDGQHLKDIAYVHFVGRDIADDSFILYGAISSGPSCFFASQDLFRDYRLNVRNTYGRDILHLFDRYQRSRQMFMEKEVLQNSISCGVDITRTKRTWHFPYTFKYNNSYERPLPDKWLCVTKGSVPLKHTVPLE